MTDRYINPFTDFGFKKLFGTEANKDLLIDFLNALLQGKETIASLTFKNIEKLGTSEVDRKAIFDLHCENEKGEKFIIELQKTKQKFFKDRTVYYSTFPIQEQAKQGAEWDFQLKAVYLVAILDFVFDEDEEQKDKFLYEVQLLDNKTCKVFYDKLMFVYLEMPKFQKAENELETTFEKWIYAFKMLSFLQERPKILKEKIFKKLFQIAEIAKLSPEERQSYEQSIKYYRDLHNSFRTAREEGREEGLEKGREEGLEKGREEGLEKGIEIGFTKGEAIGEIKGKIKSLESLKNEGLLAEEQFQNRVVPLEKKLKALQTKVDSKT